MGKAKVKKVKRTAKLGDVRFTSDGCARVGFSAVGNAYAWPYQADALVDIIAPTWAWKYPAKLSIYDHTTNRRLA